jgi:RNA-binding protein
MNMKKTKKLPHLELTSQDIRELKSKVHHLKPVVIIGSNGLTDAVIQEINLSLNTHELIKIRIHLNDSKEGMTEIVNEICTKTQAVSIQMIGHIAAIYRKNPQHEEG